MSSIWFCKDIRTGMEILIQTTACCKTDPGLRRSCNEDTCLIHNERGYFLVADGIGGAAAGEIASALFAKTAAEIFLSSSIRSSENTLQLVKDCFLTANSRILADIAATPAHTGMGCTAELLVMHDNGFVLGHIGDSRTYRLRQATLTQLTKDHSLVQQQIEQGLISQEQARKHPMKNVILRAVGINEQLAIDIIQGQVFPGDFFLLCSDGLSDMVEDKRIEEALLTGELLTEKAARLVDLANAAGGRDNITVALIEVQ
jgi:serine/threonine protein phosphatase PrpC